MAAEAGSATSPLPFAPGERLAYDISWMGVIGGEGVLQVGGPVNLEGRRAYTIEAIGRSTGFVRKLYIVDDHTVSYLDIQDTLSRRVEVNISEGRYRKTKIIDFDHDAGKATLTIDAKPPEEYDIAPGSQDSFSALYALRTMRRDIRVGKSVFIPLFEDKKKYELEVKTLGRERLNLPQGKIDTIVVEPLLKTEGIFRRRGKMRLWLSDDEHLAPIMVSSKILIGSFVAVLREYEGIDLNFIPYE